MGAKRKLNRVRTQNGERSVGNLQYIFQLSDGYVWNTRHMKKWIHIRPQMEEQMPDDDTPAPAPGHFREAAGLGGSHRDMALKICDTTYLEGVMVHSGLASYGLNKSLLPVVPV
ncbi:MAG: hypothetical protein GY696_11245 [Gammaproteobacteria bacterium]|nr:hypothetical protein [Gammaproteobacteria bacterium]